MQECFIKFKELFKTLLASRPLQIIVAGLLLFIILVAVRERPARGKSKKIALPVTAIRLERINQQAVINGYGTIEPREKLKLKAQVSGEIIWLSPRFEKGAVIKRGEVIAKIDSRDYEALVALNRAELERARVALKEEESRREVAIAAWKLLKEELGKRRGKRELLLRTAQLNEKKAAVNAALSQLKKAELDLKRTVIKAPFDALVISKYVALGSYLSPAVVIAELAALDELRVEASVPVKDLSLLDFQHPGNVKVIPIIAGEHKDAIPARFIRVLGDLEPSGKMARVLVGIPIKSGNNLAQAGLLLGSFVQVQITGIKLNDVYQIPLKAFRDQDSVWLVDEDNTLRIKKVKKVFADRNSVIVKGLSAPA
ncbi:MAG: efflux RND transporter periplasmic adaptor subunit, partial [Candidatus Dadabacteria bacterium]